MSELNRRSIVEGELAALGLELAEAEGNIGKLQEKLGKPLSGFPSGRLRTVAAERLRDEAKLTAEQAVAAELRQRLAEAQRELATIAAEERAVFLRGLDAETTAAAREFIPKFEQFVADWEAFRAVYYRNRAEGVRRVWPLTDWSQFSGREYQWLGVLTERLDMFRACLGRAEAGLDE